MTRNRHTVCMIEDNLQPALFGCQEVGEAWDVVERGQVLWERLTCSWVLGRVVEGDGEKMPLLVKESMVSGLDCHVLLIHMSVHLIPKWH